MSWRMQAAAGTGLTALAVTFVRGRLHPRRFCAVSTGLAEHGSDA